MKINNSDNITIVARKIFEKCDTEGGNMKCKLKYEFLMAKVIFNNKKSIL